MSGIASRAIVRCRVWPRRQAGRQRARTSKRARGMQRPRSFGREEWLQRAPGLSSAQRRPSDGGLLRRSGGAASGLGRANVGQAGLWPTGSLQGHARVLLGQGRARTTSRLGDLPVQARAVHPSRAPRAPERSVAIRQQVPRARKGRAKAFFAAGVGCAVSFSACGGPGLTPGVQALGTCNPDAGVTSHCEDPACQAAGAHCCSYPHTVVAPCADGGTGDGGDGG